MLNEKYYIDLIRRYFSGQLSSKEELELLSWLELRDENLELFDLEKRNLNGKNIDNPMVESSLSEVKRRVKSNRKRANTISLYNRALKYTKTAAVAALLIGVGYLISTVQNTFNSSNPSWVNITTPRGDKTKLDLPDGSVVWLNAETTLSYPDNFADNRVLKLTGEAYFEVKKQDGDLFSVETSDYTVDVLGTKFNVMAYEDYNRTETSLFEGSIKIKRGAESLIMKPGQEITFSSGKFLLDKRNIRDTSCWKDNKFDFDNITFNELVCRLERWYDVDIKINSDILKEIKYSGAFKNKETIWQVLDVIQLTLPFNYRSVGDREIEINGNK